MFPDTSSDAFCGTVALEALAKLRTYGFKCGNNCEVAIFVAQAERLLDAQQYDDVAKMCSPKEEDKHGVLSLHNIVKGSGKHSDEESRRNEIQGKLFLYWASSYFARTIKVDGGGEDFLSAGVRFLEVWFGKMGNVDSKPKFEANVHNILTYSASSANQSKVGSIQTSLEDCFRHPTPETESTQQTNKRLC